MVSSVGVDVMNVPNNGSVGDRLGVTQTRWLPKARVNAENTAEGRARGLQARPDNQIEAQARKEKKRRGRTERERKGREEEVPV